MMRGFRFIHPNYISILVHKVRFLRNSGRLSSLVHENILYLDICGCMDCTPLIIPSEGNFLASVIHMPRITSIMINYQQA